MKNIDHARLLSRGKSFEYSPWREFVKYSNDCFRQDFVSYENVLLACKQTHISSIDTKPNLIYLENNVIKCDSEYWELVMTGVLGSPGITPKLKIENGYWYVSYDNGVTWDSVGSASNVDFTWGEY